MSASRIHRSSRLPVGGRAHTAAVTAGIRLQAWDGIAMRNETRRWYRILPADVAAELVQFHRSQPAAALDIDGFELRPWSMPRLTAYGAELREQLQHGSGLIWLRGLDRLGLTLEQLRLSYLALGCGIGELMTDRGQRFPVADQGGAHFKRPFSASHAATPTGFHTDSRRDCVPDVVGLLCECAGGDGGESLVSNALHAHRVLREHAPDILRILEDRFAVFTPAPERPEGLLFRYLRSGIEAGQKKAGAPLGVEELRAFDLLDRVLEQHALSFGLERGDAAFVNNRFLAHGRGADRYTSDPVPLQRLWIRTPNPALTG